MGKDFGEDIFEVLNKLLPSSTVHINISFTFSSSQESKEPQGVKIDGGELLSRAIPLAFNLNELELLAKDIGVSIENLHGSTLEMKSSELVSYFVRRGRLEELISALLQERPKINWPNLQKELLQ